MTGSLYNQMGQADRALRAPAPAVSKPARREPEKSGGGASKGTTKAPSKESSGSFSIWMAIVAFAVVALLIYDPVSANGIVSLICGLVAGGIAGRLWKVILAFAGILGVLYAVGAILQANG
jgi:hypothetical protein